MRLSVVALNSVFMRSGERPVDILTHLLQRFEKLADVQPLQDPFLVGRLHVLNFAVSQGHSERVP